MKDRLPAYGMANRVKITQDDGNIVEGVLSYADGATQEGSAYNKANVLPDSICKALGLSVESEPKDMFGVLADCGELHVWRKKVVVADKIPAIPAGYTIGELVNLNLTVGIPIYYGKSGEWEYVTDVSSISVSDDGSVHFNNARSFSISDGPIGYDISEVNILKGKYVRCTKLPEGWGSEGIEPSAPPSVGNVYYFPSDTAFIKKEFSTGTEHNGEVVNFFEIMATKYKEVTGYPYTPEIPAGTTTTYPVSTNPNAYQEGDDAKEAGYTLGEVETGKFVLGTGMGSNAQNMFYISSSVTVDDSGNISQENRGSTYINGEDNNTMQGQANNVIGKFVVLNSKQSNSDFDVGTIWYIPPDVTIRNSYSTDGEAYDQFNITNYVTKRQPVTGYAAIPAGTTIEYLGKLGDKARVQVVSYVGTGRSGADNQNSLTFDFVPKLLLIKSDAKSAYYICLTLFGTTLTDTYEDYAFFDATGNMTYPDSSYARKNGKKIQWYSLRNAYVQANGSGMKYTAIAIG